MAGWLSGWDYRKRIAVTNASADYQTKVLVGQSSGATGEEVDCGGNVADDFDDIRFTAADGTTLLDYWIESLSGANPNILATIWVENNSTPDTVLYMYYGGTETAVSNAANTFIQYHGAANADFHDADVTPTSGGLRYRARAKGSGAALANMQIGLCNVDHTQSDDAMVIVFYETTNLRYVKAVNEGTSTNISETPDINDGSYHTVEGRLLFGTSLIGFADEDQISTSVTTNLPNEAMGLSMWLITGTGDQLWSWVGKYAATEPSFAFGDEIAAQYPSSVIIGIVASATKTITITRSATVLIGNLVSTIVSIRSLVLIGITVSATKAVAYARSFAVIVGNLVSATRKWNRDISSSVLVGVLVSATRVWGRNIASSVIVGVVTTASRAVAWTRGSSVIVGNLVSATRSIVTSRTTSVIVGVLVTASRTVAQTISSSVSVGIVTTATRAVAAVRSTSVIIGNLVSATRTGVLSRASSVIIGTLVSATRVVARTRISSVIVGMTVSASRTVAYTRSATVTIGNLVSAIVKLLSRNEPKLYPSFRSGIDADLVTLNADFRTGIDDSVISMNIELQGGGE